MTIGESLKLKDLKPGDVFKRTGGSYRYVVTDRQEESCGNIRIYCHNLDGETSGYYHEGRDRVVLLYTLVSEAPSTPTKPKPFWMCYVEGGDYPKHKHPNESEARCEAERLAKLTGKPTFVLRAISMVATQPAMVHWTEQL